jgi:hypothetical protein
MLFKQKLLGSGKRFPESTKLTQHKKAQKGSKIRGFIFILYFG